MSCEKYFCRIIYQSFCWLSNRVYFLSYFITIFFLRRQLRVFEVNQVLPRFVTFFQIDQSAAQQKLPESFISFRLQSQIDMLRLWISENFTFIDEEKIQNESRSDTDLEGRDDGKKINLYFLCTRDQEILYITWDLIRFV